MSKEMKELINSYPETYSNKELVYVIMAETGEFVSERLIGIVRGNK